MDGRKFKTEDVSWKVLDIEIFGTITYPDDGVAHPGIVMVAGSGPTDRDWCSPLLPGHNGSGKLLAEALALKGYVTLRYDKMASGPHVMENLPRFSGKASMETHLEEVAGALSALISRGYVKKDRVFALTNSEGGIHAANYQLSSRKPKCNGCIMTGAPGRSVGEVARNQLAAQGKSFPGADGILKKYDSAVEQFLEGKPMNPEDTLPQVVKLMLKSLESPHNLPFSRELWTYSLSEHVRNITEPVLVIIGKKDIQISWEDDGRLLEESLSGNSDAEFAYPDDANHVLKHEDLPLEEITAEYAGTHYNSADSILDTEALNIIISWLGRHS